MIHRTIGHRRPLGRRHRVAGFTHTRGINVRPALAAGVGAVVTADTVTGDATVIHRRP